jgi:hypothetical protein
MCMVPCVCMFINPDMHIEMLGNIFVVHEGMHPCVRIHARVIRVSESEGTQVISTASVSME